jgi:hypothetical protein
MTDDLVKRLRDGDEFERFMLAERAADRIEELERLLGLADDQRREWEHHCKAAETKLEKAVGALASVIDACNEGRIIPRPGCGIGGMTIEANIKGSMYTGVPAWPIEEALITLAELKEQK